MVYSCSGYLWLCANHPKIQYVDQYVLKLLIMPTSLYISRLGRGQCDNLSFLHDNLGFCWGASIVPICLMHQYQPFTSSLSSFIFYFFFYLQWILSYIEMKQPWVYMYSPSRSPLPLPSPPVPSRFSHCTRSECLSHASNLGW